MSCILHRRRRHRRLGDVAGRGRPRGRARPRRRRHAGHRVRVLPAPKRDRRTTEDVLGDEAYQVVGSAPAEDTLRTRARPRRGGRRDRTSRRRPCRASRPTRCARWRAGRRRRPARRRQPRPEHAGRAHPRLGAARRRAAHARSTCSSSTPPDVTDDGRRRPADRGLADRLDVDLPLVEQVEQVLLGGERKYTRARGRRASRHRPSTRSAQLWRALGSRTVDDDDASSPTATSRR